MIELAVGLTDKSFGSKSPIQKLEQKCSPETNTNFQMSSGLPSVRLLEAFIDDFRLCSPSAANQFDILRASPVKELKVLLLCRALISMVALVVLMHNH